MPRWTGPIVALALGLTAVFAFAPFGAFPLMPLTLAALFWLGENHRPRHAFFLGWLFGLAEFAFGIYWIYISIHLIGEAPVWLAIAMLAALVAIMGLFSATAMWAGAYLAPTRSWRRYVIMLPVLWALTEWVRSWFLSGFPWLAVGYSQTDSPLAGFGPIIGVFGIGWVVAISAGLLVLALAPLPRLATASRQAWRCRALAIIALIGVWALGYGLRSVAWTQPAGAPLKVSLVQGNIAQSVKWSPEVITRSMTRYRRLTLPHLDSQLIVWPETAIPTLLQNIKSYYLAPLAQQISARGGALALGIPVAKNGHYYNAVLLLDGEQPQFYFKQHLVPFGEYFPVPQWVRRWLKYMNLPYSSFTPGAPNQLPLKLGQWRVAFVICYEDVFGAQLARVLPQANLLIETSDDAWFGNSIALPQHLQIARMRAIEAGRYMLRATNTGITAVIDQTGEVVKRLPPDTAGVLTASVSPYTGATPYARTGNLPLVLFLFAVAIVTTAVTRATTNRR